jgi:hypothetical protein
LSKYIDFVKHNLKDFLVAKKAAQREKQAKINEESVETPESFPRAPWTDSRKE